MKKILFLLLLIPAIAYAGTITFVQDIDDSFLSDNIPKKDEANVFTQQNEFPTVKLTTGATNGYVLTSDAAGVGSWAAAAGGGANTNGFALKKSGSTLTISREDGSALSPSNSVLVRIKSDVTTGESIDAEITANVTWVDGLTGDFDGNTLGMDTGVAWSEDYPIFIYLANKNDTQFEFFLSRDPTKSTTLSATTYIAEKGDANADDQTGMLLITSGETLSTWTDKPVVLIGALTATKDASDDYTMLIDTVNDGFGETTLNYMFSKWWRMATGQNGADSGSFFSGNTGTPPSWATPSAIDYFYQIQRDGTLQNDFSTRDAGNCTNGTTTNALDLSTAYYSNHQSSNNYLRPTGIVRRATVFNLLHMGLQGQNLPTPLVLTANVSIRNNEFSSPDDDIATTFYFRAF